MAAQVVVVGGGYAGIAVAKALDDTLDVVLVDPKDAFVHAVAALRGLVGEPWTRRMFFEDLWFRCFGVEPASDLLTGTLASAWRPDGFVEVDDPLVGRFAAMVDATPSVPLAEESRR